MVTDVFNVKRLFAWQLYLVGYGVSLVIMTTTFIVSVVQGHEYFREDACWLESPYIWAFKGPVAVIVGLNLIVLGTALYKSFSVSAT